MKTDSRFIAKPFKYISLSLFTHKQGSLNKKTDQANSVVQQTDANIGLLLK
jgi:hypothetical protein